MKLIFVKMSITVSYKLILSFLICVVRHAYRIQNNKYAISLQYLRIELYADNMKVFYKPVSLFLMDLARHVQIMWIKSAIF